MRFWDSSALVPLLVEEPTTNEMRAVLRDDPEIVVWMMTSVELLSALGRLGRQVPEVADLVATMRFEALNLVKQCATIVDADSVRRRAERIIGVHPLAAADAQQLAAGLVAAEDRPETLEFVTLDRLLAQRARLEGFRVVTA